MVSLPAAKLYIKGLTLEPAALVAPSRLIKPRSRPISIADLGENPRNTGRRPTTANSEGSPPIYEHRDTLGREEDLRPPLLLM